MKKVTERMCAMCRERKDKSNLIRIAKHNGGEIEIDLNGRVFGRGAYVCKNETCIKNAEKKSALERSFKCKIDRSIYEKLNDIAKKCV